MSTFTITSSDNGTGPFGSGNGEGYASGDTFTFPPISHAVGSVTPDPSSIAGATLGMACFIGVGAGGTFNIFLQGTLAQNTFSTISFTDRLSVVETFNTAAATYDIATYPGFTLWSWPQITHFPFTNNANYVMTVTGEIFPVTGPIPGVIGLLLADAEAAVIAAGFTVNAVTTANSFIAAGSVADQTPAGGTIELIGSSVALVNSLGIVIPTVPLQALFVDAPVYKALLLANPGNINPRIYPPEVDTTARVLPQRIISS